MAQALLLVQAKVVGNKAEVEAAGSQEAKEAAGKAVKVVEDGKATKAVAVVGRVIRAVVGRVIKAVKVAVGNRAVVIGIRAVAVLMVMHQTLQPMM